jgi:hypothetical protein
MEEIELEICPGNPGKPFFKTPAEQDRFYEELGEKIREELSKLPRPIWFRPHPRRFGF